MRQHDRNRFGLGWPDLLGDAGQGGEHVCHRALPWKLGESDYAQREHLRNRLRDFVEIINEGAIVARDGGNRGY